MFYNIFRDFLCPEFGTFQIKLYLCNRKQKRPGEPGANNYTTMTQTTIKEVKKGEYFRLAPNGPVWVRGYYERSSRKYEAYKYDNINSESFFKGDKKCYIDFDF